MGIDNLLSIGIRWSNLRIEHHIEVTLNFTVIQKEIFNFHELDIFLLVRNVAVSCTLLAAGPFARLQNFPEEINYVF
jgi:hypothetical protein